VGTGSSTGATTKDSKVVVYNSVQFTIAYDSTLPEVQEFIDVLKRRGGEIVWLGKTEYKLLVADHLPIQTFVDVLRLTDCIYWVDDKVEVQTYCPSLRG